MERVNLVDKHRWTAFVEGDDGFSVEEAEQGYRVRQGSMQTQ